MASEAKQTDPSARAVLPASAHEAAHPEVSTSGRRVLPVGSLVATLIVAFWIPTGSAYAAAVLTAGPVGLMQSARLHAGSSTPAIRPHSRRCVIWHARETSAIEAAGVRSLDAEAVVNADIVSASIPGGLRSAAIAGRLALPPPACRAITLAA